MKIPFLNRPETRAGYTDLLVQAILQEATGSTTASVASLGVDGSLRRSVGQELLPAQRLTPAGRSDDGLDACGPRGHRAAAPGASVKRCLRSWWMTMAR